MAPIGKIRDGDMIRLDAEAGTLEVLVDADELEDAHGAAHRSVGKDARLRPRTVRRLPRAGARADHGASAFGGVN